MNRVFFFRWSQAKAISQQAPRWAKPESSPHKTTRSLNLPTPLKLRRTNAIVSDSIDDGPQNRNLVPVATPYRLPKLSEQSNYKPKDYVFIQPLSASHFLIHKDPM